MLPGMMSWLTDSGGFTVVADDAFSNNGNTRHDRVVLAIAAQDRVLPIIRLSITWVTVNFPEQNGQDSASKRNLFIVIASA